MSDMIEMVRQWLDAGKVDLFLGYKMVAGHPLPYGFNKDNLEELEELMVGQARYSLEKMATEILESQPALKIGILGRDCTRRALNVLAVHKQIDTGQIKVLDVSCCPSQSHKQSDCSALTPRTYGEVKLELGIDNNMSVAQCEQYDQPTRFAKWMYEFQKCLKCYGCRDICPVCFCKECSLEHGDLVETGGVPPEVPIFHLIRAVHMAGRCIDCGLCEDACPVDIPLRLLYRKGNAVVKDLFGYETGFSQDQPPFSILGESAPGGAEAHREAK